jgi:hypothetical protein
VQGGLSRALEADVREALHHASQQTSLGLLARHTVHDSDLHIEARVDDQEIRGLAANSGLHDVGARDHQGIEPLVAAFASSIGTFHNCDVHNSFAHKFRFRTHEILATCNGNVFNNCVG